MRMRQGASRLNNLIDAIGGAGFIVVSLLLSPFMRVWHARWGAFVSDINRSLPGDQLVLHPTLETTRAVTIHAPPEQVWPWLVQVGQGRGGFYSYDMLENLAGCAIHSAERILPDCQVLLPGDLVRLGPEGYPFYMVASVVPERSLVLIAADPQSGEPGNNSWAFLLEPYGKQAARLLSRTRTHYEPTFVNTLIWRVLTDAIQFVMERRMLLGIKERAEGNFYQNTP